jgi:mRNA interferase RelE/StbE
VKVEFRRSFEKDLGKIRDGELLDRIKDTIESIENAESILEVNNIKKLKADGDYYRIRVGDYRIGFTLDEESESIVLVRILHRREMYRYFP